MSKIYSLAEITYKSMPIIIKKEPLIYFLLKTDQIVYVGQTRNSISDRILSHSKEKDFDSFSYFVVNGNELDKLEADNIIYHHPKYNQLVNSNFYRTPQNMAKYFGINLWEFRRIIKKHLIEGYQLNDRIFFKNTDFLRRTVDVS